MSSFLHRFLPGAALLSAVLLWLVSVTLCSTRTVAMEPPHDHGPAAADSGHKHDADHHHGQGSEDNCGCKSFSAFSATAVALTKAPTPPPPSLLYALVPDEFAWASVTHDITAHNTGPPGRILLADWILERCRLDHAPPFVV